MPDDVTPDGAQEEAVETAPSGEAAPEFPGQNEGEDYKAYAERMAKENQAYREKWQPYERTFSSNEDAQKFFTAAQALADGRTDEVSGWMLQNVAAMLDVEPDVLLALSEEGEFDDDDDIDDMQATIDRLVEEKVSQRFGQIEESQTEAQVDLINEDLRGMGFEPGTFEAQSVLWFALNETNGDLEAAKAKFEAFQQAPVDKYVEGKREEARANARKTSGQAPSTERKISLDDAADAAREFLEAQA